MVQPTISDLREECGGCGRGILLHKQIASCNVCKKLVHAKCTSEFLIYDTINANWTCKKCQETKEFRYNPFNACINSAKAGQEPASDNSDITEISQILNACSRYTPEQFSEMMKNYSSTGTSQLSLLFNNIDGNATNFDSLAAELSALENKFSVIALAETNIDKEHGALYQLSGYQPVYQSKIANKRSGSGLGIYIRNDMDSCEAPEFSHCSKNMESFFIVTKNTKKPITLGVVYRPPSGNESEFHAEFETLLKALPRKNVMISGDFNMDLFSENKKYENMLYSNGYIPTISIATNQKPGCRPTCIDNIFVNNWDEIICSGALSNKITSHSPVFATINTEFLSSNDSNKSSPKYDLSDKNLNIFLEKLSNILTHDQYTKINSMEGEHIEQLFCDFAELFESTMKESLVVPDEVLSSKRNVFMNPWITPGIIASVQTKCSLYTDWKDTVTNTNPSGDCDIYEKYSNFRRKLKYVIRSAKNSYYGKKFQKHNGDMKKTWQLINEIRGKTKKKAKPYFMVDGQLVQDRRLISEKFNSYFSNIAESMNDDMAQSLAQNLTEIPAPEKYFHESTMHSIFTEECSIEEIATIISELEIGKSSDIPIKVMKHCNNLLSPIIANFINSFLRHGIFPKNLKIGRITPIFNVFIQ